MPLPRPATVATFLRTFIALSLLAGVIAPGPAALAMPSAQVAGATLTILAAPVELASGGGEFAPAMDGQIVGQGDSLRTGFGGLALLTFFDGSETQLVSDTQLSVDALGTSEQRGINLFQVAGTTLNRVNPASVGTFQTQTPVATGLVRGTAYTVTVNGAAAAAGAAAGGSTPATSGQQSRTIEPTPPPAAVIPPVSGPVVAYPRVIDDTGYWLMGEAFYPDAEGYWQVRTWQDPGTASSWDTFERLGLASNLLGEAVYAQDGILWRVRTWRDATDGFTWDTYDSLGSASQSPAGTQQAASVSAAPLSAAPQPCTRGSTAGCSTTIILVRGALQTTMVQAANPLALQPGQVLGQSSSTQVVGTLSDAALDVLRQWDTSPRSASAVGLGSSVTEEATQVVNQVLQQGSSATDGPESRPLPTAGSVRFIRVTEVEPGSGVPTKVSTWTSPPPAAPPADTGAGTPPPPPPPPLPITDSSPTTSSITPPAPTGGGDSSPPAATSLNLSGRLVDGAGTPLLIPGVSVNAENVTRDTSFSTLTLAAGEFAFSNLTTGNYDLVVDGAAGYTQQSVPRVNATSLGTYSRNIVLRPNDATVGAVIRDAGTNLVVSGVKTFAYASSAGGGATYVAATSAPSALDGSTTLSLASGTYSAGLEAMQYNAAGYLFRLDRHTNVTVAPGSNPALSYALPTFGFSGGPCAVAASSNCVMTVNGTGYAPNSAVTVTLYLTGTTPIAAGTVTTDSLGALSGSLAFSRPVAGSYQVQVNNTSAGRVRQARTLATFDVRPVNDAFAQAQALTLPASTSGSTLLATTETGEPIHAGDSSCYIIPSHRYYNSVWFKFTPTQTGTVLASTANAGTNFDTALALYTGTSLGGLTLVGCDNNGDNPNPPLTGTDPAWSSKLQAPVVVGRTYMLQLAGIGGATAGNYALTLNLTPAPGVNIAGQLVDAMAASLPLPGVTVYAKNLTSSTSTNTVTNATGQFSFTGLATGNYDLVVYNGVSGYTQQTVPRVAAATNGSYTRNIAVKANDATVSGSISEAGLIPVSGASVSAYAPNTDNNAFYSSASSSASGSTGAYTLSIASGTYAYGLEASERNTTAYSLRLHRRANSVIAAGSNAGMNYVLPTLTFASTLCTAGTCTMTVAGSGYEPGGTVSIDLKGTSRISIGSVIANTSGSFSQLVTFASPATASYQLQADNSSSSGYRQAITAAAVVIADPAPRADAVPRAGGAALSASPTPTPTASPTPEAPAAPATSASAATATPTPAGATPLPTASATPPGTGATATPTPAPVG